MTPRSTAHIAILAAALALGCDNPSPEPEPNASAPDRPEPGYGDGERDPEPLPDLPEPGDGDGAPEPVGPGVCQRHEDPALLEQVASFAGCPEPDQWICSIGDFPPNPVATVCCDQGPPYQCRMLAPAGDCLAVYWTACEV